jgi:polyferredoxin
MALLLLTAFFSVPALAAARFPHPDFDTGYVLPATTTPLPRAGLWAWIDVAALFVVLALTTYFAIRRRSRAGILALTLASIAYFGFWRRGCVCPVGAVQNVALALCDPAYVVPASVLLFFALPLIFTLFFGRTFCAAVCPLGAIQDVVVLRPAAIPTWLARLGRMTAMIYLAVAILCIAAGRVFAICPYDPFVGFYRLSGPAPMLAVGGGLLLIGVVVARPYCRFLCPYGVLLNWAARLSRWHVTITPDECDNCRLCEQSCPFGAIRVPPAPPAATSRAKELRLLMALLLLIPLAGLAGAWAGVRIAPVLAAQHPTVRLARLVASPDATGQAATSIELDAFRQSAKTPAELYAEAGALQSRFRKGSGVAGGLVGAVFMLELVALTLRRQRKEYVPDRGECLSCGRCFRYCPREYARHDHAKT